MTVTAQLALTLAIAAFLLWAIERDLHRAVLSRKRDEERRRVTRRVGAKITPEQVEVLVHGMEKMNVAFAQVAVAMEQVAIEVRRMLDTKSN